jgi:hypothetical protein
VTHLLRILLWEWSRLPHLYFSRMDHRGAPEILLIHSSRTCKLKYRRCCGDLAYFKYKSEFKQNLTHDTTGPAGFLDWFCVNLPPCRKANGDLSEWLKEHAWKVCIPQKGIEGSNPSVSAFISTQIFYDDYDFEKIEMF